MKRGITISHHDDEKGKRINWEKVAQGDIQYVFAKSTEGKTFQDNTFQENFHKIKATSGSEAGAFHVFRMTSTPEDQVQNIKEALSEAGFDTVIDKLAICTTTVIDKKTPDGREYTNQERAKNLNFLLQKLEEEEYNLIVHVLNKQDWDSYFTQGEYDFSKYPLCLAYRGEREPQIPQGWERCDYWNTDKTRVIDVILTSAVSEVSIEGISEQHNML